MKKGFTRQRTTSGQQNKTDFRMLLSSSPGQDTKDPFRISKELLRDSFQRFLRDFQNAGAICLHPGGMVENSPAF
jgi:hypothetical protein